MPFYRLLNDHEVEIAKKLIEKGVKTAIIDETYPEADRSKHSVYVPEENSSYPFSVEKIVCEFRYRFIVNSIAIKQTASRSMLAGFNQFVAINIADIGDSDGNYSEKFLFKSADPENIHLDNCVNFDIAFADFDKDFKMPGYITNGTIINLKHEIARYAHARKNAFIVGLHHANIPRCLRKHIISYCEF